MKIRKHRIKMSLIESRSLNFIKICWSCSVLFGISIFVVILIIAFFHINILDCGLFELFLFPLFLVSATLIPVCIVFHGREDIFNIFAFCCFGTPLLDKKSKLNLSFKEFSCATTSLWIVYGSIFGSVLSALDWDVPYQHYPYNCFIGSFAGFILSIFYLHHFRNQVKQLNLCKQKFQNISVSSKRNVG
ncbi:uncharacterized protein MONOS_18648 [Monocercomonoides exilis]|uniref:uncharacterized protein n=1 Tax=Monocercomonoides exilis TaxID=2049356 RepID=UPI00355A2C1B|nr:hypothetical protein MONOS_18648 [Monocercomonoides exilis]